MSPELVSAGINLDKATEDIHTAVINLQCIPLITERYSCLITAGGKTSQIFNLANKLTIEATELINLKHAQLETDSQIIACSNLSKRLHRLFAPFTFKTLENDVRKLEQLIIHLYFLELILFVEKTIKELVVPTPIENYIAFKRFFTLIPVNHSILTPEQYMSMQAKLLTKITRLTPKLAQQYELSLVIPQNVQTELSEGSLPSSEASNSNTQLPELGSRFAVSRPV